LAYINYQTYLELKKVIRARLIDEGYEDEKMIEESAQKEIKEKHGELVIDYFI
jgi:hypothetical protein